MPCVAGETLKLRTDLKFQEIWPMKFVAKKKKIAAEREEWTRKRLKELGLFSLDKWNIEDLTVFEILVEVNVAGKEPSFN